MAQKASSSTEPFARAGTRDVPFPSHERDISNNWAAVEKLIGGQLEYFQANGHWLSYFLLPLTVEHIGKEKRDDGTYAILHELRQIEMGRSQISKGVIRPELVESKYGPLDQYFATKIMHDRRENYGYPHKPPITPSECFEYLQSKINDPSLFLTNDIEQLLEQTQSFISKFRLISFHEAGKKPTMPFNQHIKSMVEGDKERNIPGHPYVYLAKQEDRSDNLGTIIYFKDGDPIHESLHRIQRYTSGTETVFDLQDITGMACEAFPEMTRAIHNAGRLNFALYRLNRYFVNFHWDNQTGNKQLSPEGFELDLSDSVGQFDESYGDVSYGLHPFFIGMNRIGAHDLGHPNEPNLFPQVQQRPYKRNQVEGPTVWEKFISSKSSHSARPA